MTAKMRKYGLVKGVYRPVMCLDKQCGSRVKDSYVETNPLFTLFCASHSYDILGVRNVYQG